MAWTAPRTWVASEVLTAALLNTYVRDNQLALATWDTSWTPAWTGATTDPVLGNGTLTGRFIKAGQRVHFLIHLTVGSTTTFGSGAWRFDLPVAEVARRFAVTGSAFDASLNDDYSLHVLRSASDLLSVKCPATTAGNAARTVNNTVPFTWANGDELYISGTYEAT